MREPGSDKIGGKRCPIDTWRYLRVSWDKVCVVHREGPDEVLATVSIARMLCHCKGFAIFRRLHGRDSLSKGVGGRSALQFTQAGVFPGCVPLTSAEYDGLQTLRLLKEERADERSVKLRVCEHKFGHGQVPPNEKATCELSGSSWQQAFPLSLYLRATSAVLQDFSAWDFLPVSSAVRSKQDSIWVRWLVTTGFCQSQIFARECELNLQAKTRAGLWETLLPLQRVVGACTVLTKTISCSLLVPEQRGHPNVTSNDACKCWTSWP